MTTSTSTSVSDDPILRDPDKKKSLQKENRNEFNISLSVIQTETQRIRLNMSDDV